jgi:hypothetical protein
MRRKDLGDGSTQQKASSGRLMIRSFTSRRGRPQPIIKGIVVGKHRARLRCPRLKLDPHH